MTRGGLSGRVVDLLPRLSGSPLPSQVSSGTRTCRPCPATPPRSDSSPRPTLSHTRLSGLSAAPAAAAARRATTRPTSPRWRRSRQRWPASTSTPSRRWLAALAATTARRSTAASTAAAAAVPAAAADGFRAVEAAERAGEGAGPAPAPARAGWRAVARLCRRLGARVTPRPCAAVRPLNLLLVSGFTYCVSEVTPQRVTPMRCVWLARVY